VSADGAVEVEDALLAVGEMGVEWVGEVEAEACRRVVVSSSQRHKGKAHGLALRSASAQSGLRLTSAAGIRDELQNV
jgi:hypothetical protein